MIAHLKNHHLKEYNEFDKHRLDDKKIKLTTTISSSSDTKRQVTLQQFSQATKPFTGDHPKQIAMTRKIAKMVCHDMQPLSILDDEGFRDLLKVAEPRYVIPSRKTMTNNIIPDMYNHRRQQIKAELSSDKMVGLALTTDGWTSCTNQSYVSFTGHIIDENMELREYCLRVEQFDARHTAVNLAKSIKMAVKDWTNPDIKEEADPSQSKDEPRTIPIYVVTDNAANITAAVKSHTSFTHVPCFGHTVQLCVNDALKKFPQFDDVFEKAKTITTHFRHSSQDTVKLTEMEAKFGTAILKLKQECPTRWNSRYHMLKRLLDLKVPVSAMLINQAKPANLLPEEWKIAEGIAAVLAPFERVTSLMSGAKYPTASMVIPVLNELKQSLWRLVVDGLAEETHDLCHALVASIDQRWPNYERSQLYAASTLLDPRYKDCAFLDAEAADLAKMHVFNVAKLMDKMSAQQVKTSASSGLPMQASDMKASESSSWEWLRKKAAQKTERALAVPVSVALQHELDEFLSVPNIPIGRDALDSDDTAASKIPLQTPLQWWASHTSNYPLLSKVVRVILAVPATSVSSERLFSRAGQIISDRRSSLTPTHAEQLCFLSKNWLDERLIANACMELKY